MDNKLKHDPLLTNFIMNSLGKNHMKILRRIKLLNEGSKGYNLTQKRKDTIREIEHIALLTVKDYFDRHNITVDNYWTVAKSILYSEDLLSLGREDWRTYATANDFKTEEVKKNLKYYKSR